MAPEEGINSSSIENPDILNQVIILVSTVYALITWMIPEHGD